jgi:hypothetical protein
MQDNPSASERRLAITHRLTIRVPSAEAEAIQQKHMAECAKLGCTILSTSIDRSNEGRINARASVRIKPDSYEAFAAVLAAPPAQITMRSQSAEDLAMPIVDADRRLAAKTALRERLTAMLHDQTVKTAGDLITIEKELAQVQTDIEAVTAQRDNLRTRTDMVRIEISYVGVAGQIGGADLSPIYQAVSQISQTVINSVAALISTLVAIVPWLPAIALIWWRPAGACDAGRRGGWRYRSIHEVAARQMIDRRPPGVGAAREFPRAGYRPGSRSKAGMPSGT